MGKRFLWLVCLLAAIAAGYALNRPEPKPATPVPDSGRQMPDFNPPLESDRPDLWEEPRVQPEEQSR